MKDELRDLLKREEALSEYEVTFTVHLCSDLVMWHWLSTHRRFEGFDQETADHDTIEALSDQNWKTAYEIQFIWQMGLWRISSPASDVSERASHFSPVAASTE